MPPITLDEPQGPRIPVMKRQRIGDTVTGAVVRTVPVPYTPLTLPTKRIV